MSFRKDLFKNILVSGGYSYLSQIINFLSSIIVSRLLSPNDYGLVGLITVFTGFILVFSDGGLTFALIRSDYGRIYHRTLTNLSWILGIVLFTLTALLAYPISLFYKNSELLWPTLILGLNFIFRSLSIVQGAILAKKLEFAYIGKVNLISILLSVLATICFAFLGYGYWALIFPQIITAIATAYFYEKKVKLGFKIFPLPYVIVALKHTKKLLGNIITFNTINYWSRNADNMIVGKWYGSFELGIYNRAYTLLSLPLTLITALFNNILFPSLKRLKSNGGNVEEEYYFVLRIIPFLSFPLVFIFILFPESIVITLWGKTWQQVANLLPYFGLLIYTQTLYSTAGHILVLEGKEKQYMFTGWVNAFFIISSIFFGATISLTAIAQFYSITYILFVLAFHLIFVFINTLKFNKKNAMLFWIPKIAISILLWVSIYLNLVVLKTIFIIFLLLYISWEGRFELIKVISKIYKLLIVKMRYKIEKL